MREFTLSLLFLALAFSGSAFGESWDSGGISQTSAPSSSGRVMVPKKDASVVGIQDPAPAIYEPGRTGASDDADSSSDSSSSSSDDYSTYSSGD